MSAAQMTYLTRSTFSTRTIPSVFQVLQPGLIEIESSVVHAKKKASQQDVSAMAMAKYEKKYPFYFSDPNVQVTVGLEPLDGQIPGYPV